MPGKKLFISTTGISIKMIEKLKENNKNKKCELQNWIKKKTYPQNETPLCGKL